MTRKIIAIELAELAEDMKGHRSLDEIVDELLNIENDIQELLLEEGLEE